MYVQPNTHIMENNTLKDRIVALGYLATDALQAKVIEFALKKVSDSSIRAAKRALEKDEIEAAKKAKDAAAAEKKAADAAAAAESTAKAATALGTASVPAPAQVAA